MEEVLPNIFRNEIPLPGNPLKAVNSYVIRGRGRNLIVDTGMNRKACIEAMDAGLRELEVDLTKTDFFITHLHADHFALVSTLATDTSTIYFNQPDGERVKSRGAWEIMGEYARFNGFPDEEVRAALSNHPGQKYGGSKFERPLHILKEGDSVSIGDYHFTCVETPGHTRGHMCLYEPEKKILFSGDHILGDITPNIQCWSDRLNPLKEYLASLDKICRMDVDVVLPGHRSIFRTCKERIDELKHHHRNRADEVLSILAGNKNNAYGVAAEMTWDIVCDSWEQFPVSQKWFATGEAIAHLRYLQEKGLVIKEKLNGHILYALP